jgi:hypothetical protein
MQRGGEQGGVYVAVAHNAARSQFWRCRDRGHAALYTIAAIYKHSIITHGPLFWLKPCLRNWYIPLAPHSRKSPFCLKLQGSLHFLGVHSPYTHTYLDMCLLHTTTATWTCPHYIFQFAPLSVIIQRCTGTRGDKKSLLSVSQSVHSKILKSGLYAQYAALTFSMWNPCRKLHLPSFVGATFTRWLFLGSQSRKQIIAFTLHLSLIVTYGQYMQEDDYMSCRLCGIGAHHLCIIES